MSGEQKQNKAADAKKTLLYRGVASELRDRIIRGVYPPNTKIPTLAALVEEFNVSAISVRRALRELAYEGLIYGEQGRGIFVKPKAVIHRVFAVDAERSIGNAIKQTGYEPRIREIKHDRVKADEEVAARLEIPAGTRVHRHQKLVYADSEPVSLHYLYFTEDIAPKIKGFLADSFVFSMLKRAGFKVCEARCEFASMALSSEHSTLMNAPAGFPMGAIYFTPLLKAGRPPLTGLTIFRSDRFVFEVNVSL